ncbi:hypothetical protein PybrP1_002785 [[Pythium] brassicae (nom. inval.)]|nr:hypothetical protein PybrP1_002785 [[Pythium] brassicae (nom. inval.)]
MKPSTFALVLLAGSAQLVSSLKLSPEHAPRFLQERASLEQELAAWKESAAGAFAKQHSYFITEQRVQSADELKEDQLRRFFLTKLHIESVQRLNPDAVFSTDSPFSLMTDKEFAKFLGKSFQRGAAVLNDQGSAAVNSTVGADTDVPTAGDKDWTTSGCVAPVKNQGECGSCWAFAAIAALESSYCLKGNPLTLFSEQQVLSCDDASGGCDGGFPGDGLNYVQKTRGVCLEEAYPYQSGESRETALGGRPVAVGVAAGNTTWKQYKGGVVSSCTSSQLDHAVLAVGYGGSSTATPFFKIKNSWGTAWGEAGYIRLRRGVAGVGTCGVIGPKSVYPEL